MSTNNTFSMPNSLSFFTRIFEILIMDVSGSMNKVGWIPGKSKLELMNEAIRVFLREKVEYRPSDYVALLAYSNSATRCCDFLNVHSEFRLLNEALDSVMHLKHGGTYMAEALQLALDMIKRFEALEEDSKDERTLVRLICYSDGFDHVPDSGILLAEELKDRNCSIEAFGLGLKPEDVNESFLRNIATTDADLNRYKFLGDAETITDTFKKLGRGTLIFEG